MANPVIINPTLTLAGQAAAFNASNDGLELKITHVSFGTAHYDPTGSEVALVAPVGNKVTVSGASRPTPYQIRMISSWREDVGQVAIGEIAFWSDNTLVFVWSKADGTVASYKTDGVSYVLFNDLAFSSVPANSISFVVDPDESVALAALAAHEGAFNAHPQYALRAKFPDYQGHLWGDVTGGANAIALTLPAIVDLTQYIKGNRFSFKATQTNTDDTTINVNGVGPVQVLKTGGLALSPGSIVAGGVYDVYYDGAKFQLTAGAGFASAEATDAEVTALTDTTSTSWISLRRLAKALVSFAKLAGATFTGDVKGVTPPQFDNDTSFITSEFLKRSGIEYGGYTNYAASKVLTAGDIGKLVAFGGSNLIATLPTGGSIPTGASVFLLCNSGALTVTASGTDTIDAVNVPGNIAMAQGDTAEFIRNGTLWRLVGGTVALRYSAMLSGPNWLTQPLFDNSKSVATTEYVMRAAGNMRGFTSLTSAATLTTAAVGTVVTVIGTFAVTLPLTSSIPTGGAIHFHNIGGGVVTVDCAAGDQYNVGSGAHPTSIALQPGATLKVVGHPGNTSWWASGSAQLQYSKVFGDTPALLDNSKLLATTEYVMRAAGNFRGFTSLTAAATLTTGAIGTLVTVIGTFNLNMPAANAVPWGSAIHFRNIGGGVVTVTCAGADTINGGTTNGLTSISLQPGATLELVSNGAAAWWASGSAQMQYSRVFGDTPAQFDNSKLYATAEFVQRALGSHSGYTPLAVSTAMTAAHVGSIVFPVGTGLTFTLPPAAGIRAGSSIKFFGNQQAGVVIQPASGTIVHNGAARASIALGPNDTVELVLTSGAGWYVVGGSLALAGSSVFENQLATNGYQKLPGGRIEQWGIGNTDASGNATVTFPIAFPNAILTCYAVDRSLSPVTANAQIIASDDGSLTGMNVYSMNDTGVAATSGFKWFAIGR